MLNANYCAACSGGWQNSTGETACKHYSTCNPGTFFTFAGNTTADRVCQACAAGTNQSGTNQSSCAACVNGWQDQPGQTFCNPYLGTCGAGNYFGFLGNATANRGCATCSNCSVGSGEVGGWEGWASEGGEEGRQLGSRQLAAGWLACLLAVSRRVAS